MRRAAPADERDVDGANVHVVVRAKRRTQCARQQCAVDARLVEKLVDEHQAEQKAVDGEDDRKAKQQLRTR